MGGPVIAREAFVRHLIFGTILRSAPLLLAVLCALAAPAAAQQPVSSRAEVAEPGGRLPGIEPLVLVQVAYGLRDPTGVAAAHDGTGRLFVTERAGRVRVVTRDGRLLEEPFLDISEPGPGQPYSEVNSGFVEQGLWSIAFHPKFRENGHVFVHYSSTRDNGTGMVVRFTVDPASPDHITPERARETRKEVLRIPQLQFHHNGGMIAFGPDGMLYVSRGDSGWPEAAQRLDQPYGRVLRINVDTPDDVPNAAPDDNPFIRWSDRWIGAGFGLLERLHLVGGGAADRHLGWRRRSWAHGLRNPYSFHFDQRTGDLFIADVGDVGWEEINWQPARSRGGQNYGWPRNEAAHCFPQQGGRRDCPVVGTLPVAQYPHIRPWAESPPLQADWGCSAMGLGVANYAGMTSVYLVGDWCSGRIWGVGWEATARRWQMEELMRVALQPTGGTVDEGGFVVMVNCNCNYGDTPATANPPGGLWRFLPANSVPAHARIAELGAPTLQQ